MITHRYLLLFISLASSAAMAQSLATNSVEAARLSTDVGTPKAAPRKPKAVEAPFYVKLYGFYGLLTPGSQVSTNYSSNSSGSNTSFKNNKIGLGAGPRAGIGVGFIVSDFINLGIDADMLFGAALTSTNNYAGTNYTSTGSTSTTFRVLSFIPNITFKALSRPSYYIYNRLGLIGGIILDYKENQTSVYTPTTGTPTNSVGQTDYQQNSLAIGYQAAFGIQFRLSQNLRGFAEVVAYAQSFKPKETLYTYTSTKGATVTKSAYYTDYKAEGDYNSTKKDGIDVYPSSSFNIVMNSIGVGAGLSFRF